MSGKLNVLLITGIVTSEHSPRMNPMLRFMLESTGRFNVRITEEFTGATAETLEGYDAVFVNYDGKVDVESPYIGWGVNAEKVLYDYVKNGGGCVMYHTAGFIAGQAMPDEFARLVGARLGFESGMRKTPKLEFFIDVDTDAHKITEGATKRFVVPQDDLFVNFEWAPGADINVLATVSDDIEDYEPEKIQVHRRCEFENIDIASIPGVGKSHAVAWTNTYGKGRVFSVTAGHGPSTLEKAPFVGLICRATEWVASGAVTIPYPDLSGLKRLRAWPYYLDMTVSQYANITSF